MEGKRRRRNTIAVKIDLIDAVGTVLKNHGYSKLGINIVAQEAGVDKNVIYRNFNDFDTLLEAYVEKQDYWLKTMKEFGKIKIENHREFMKQLLLEQFNTLYSNRELQQLLIWELGDKGDFTTSLAVKREIYSEGIIKQYQPLLDDFGVDFNSIAAMMIAGIYYLILHKDKSTFCETDINHKNEREDFMNAINWLVDLVFDKREKVSEIEKVAINAYKEGIEIKTISKITTLSIEKIKSIVE
jgi:AcrR family transcriptional regulator